MPHPRPTRPGLTSTDLAFGRRRFLRVGAGLIVALVAPSTRAAAQGTAPDASGALPSGPPVPPGQLRLLTAPDHWDPAVLQALAADQGVDVRITPLTDDATAFADVSAGAVDADIVSGDGLWILPTMRRD